MVWLYANNRVDEAEKVIRNAAKLNNIAMPDNILAGKSTDEDSEAKDRKGESMFAKFTNVVRQRRAQKEQPGARYTLLDVFRNLRLALYCIIMSILWSVAVICLIK